jgi:hypothetical protein
MTDAAWTKVFHDDLLHGCRAANMTGEEIGVYCTVLWLIASRGAPIEFDSRWIAGFAGVTPRKATTIINKLGGMPNKLVVRNGMIGNRKMLRTVAERDKKSDQARAAAHARWHGDEAELPLDHPRQKQGDKQGDNPLDNREIIDQIKPKKSQKTAKADDADASPSVRARDSETQNNISTIPNPPIEGSGDETAPGGLGADEPKSRLHDGDLMDWYQAIAHASGHNPVMPGQIDRAMRFVEAWRKDGIDLDEIIIPTIKATVAATSDPTRTLGRFDARIRHEQARKGATPASRAYKAPASPIVEQPGEEECMAPMRADLLKRLGPQTFARYVNAVLFETVPDAPQGRRILRVIDKRSGPMVLMDDERATTVRAIARKHGFDDVW